MNYCFTHPIKRLYLGIFRREKVLNRRGTSRAIVILAIIASALIIAILVPVVMNALDGKAREADDLHVQTAVNSARLRFVQENVPFNALYDSENKRFVDIGKGTEKVEPYGNSKQNEGKIIYLRVDENGDVYTKWVYPDDFAGY